MADIVRAPSVLLQRPAAIDPAEPARIYLGSLSTPKSRQTAIEALRRMVAILGFATWELTPWGQLTARETEQLRTLVAERYRSSTARLTLSVLRGVLRQAFRLGHMDAEQYQRAVDLRPIRGEQLVKGRAMRDEEVGRLWRYIDEEMPAQLGDMVRALFAVTLGGGLRREEVSRLSVTDVEPEGGRLLVHGKGNKQRIQKLPNWAADLVRTWVDSRGSLGLRTGSLFVPFSVAGRISDRPLSGCGVWRIVVRVTKAAGIEAITPHDLRRTFATQMLRKERVPIVKMLMGHSNASTTLRYDRSEQSEAEAAVSKGLEEWDPSRRLDPSRSVRRLRSDD